MSERAHLDARVEILSFFSANPLATDTAEGIAAKLGYPKENVDAELERLVQIGILRCQNNGARAFYSYVAPSSPIGGDDGQDKR